jgi:pyrroline-5-carboxylate reductase
VVISSQDRVSAVAGATHAAVRRHLGEDVTIVRAIPLPAVRHRNGITALFPLQPVVQAMFNALGGTVAVADEHAFATLSTTTATISAYLHYLGCIAGWAARQGVEPAAADRYVRSVFAGVGDGLSGHTGSLEELMTAHGTPSGINEQLRRSWFDSSTESALADALDAVLERVTRP